MSHTEFLVDKQPGKVKRRLAHARCRICYPVAGIAYVALCGTSVPAGETKRARLADLPPHVEVCVVCASMSRTGCPNSKRHA